jgi:2-oxo-4-hydroxy-4-carboxy-5-ureidoimidazoline decarboxylase
MTVDEINQLTAEQAYLLFERCCVAPNWISAMEKARPFDHFSTLLAASQSIWDSLEESDYLAAFKGHPKIGDVSSLQKKYADTADIAGSEQSGMSSASLAVIKKMAQLNHQYLEKFGFIFIVCASGKSAQDMLTILEQRINNDYNRELINAAAEQAKITQLRLAKLKEEL